MMAGSVQWLMQPIKTQHLHQQTSSRFYQYRIFLILFCYTLVILRGDKPKSTFLKYVKLSCCCFVFLATEIDWIVPRLYYNLQCRRVEKKKPLVWGEQNITDPTVAMFIVQEPSLCELWEFRFCAAIDEGVGPFRGIEQSFFAPSVTKPQIKLPQVKLQQGVFIKEGAFLKEGGSVDYRVSDWKFLKFCIHAFSVAMCSVAFNVALLSSFLSPLVRAHCFKICHFNTQKRIIKDLKITMHMCC